MENKKTIKLKNEIVHNWTVLCSGSSVDEQSNNISLFNIIENLKFKFVPGIEQQKEKESKGWYAAPFNFWLVTKIQKPNIDLDLSLDLRYQIIDPKGKKIGKQFGATLKFGAGTDSLRIRNQIGTFPVTGSGIYRITVRISEVGMEEFTQIEEMSFKLDVDVKEVK